MAERADEQRLGQAGHAHQQGVATAEDGDEHLLDHLVLANDHLGELAAHALVGLAQLPDEFRVAGGFRLDLRWARACLGSGRSVLLGFRLEVEPDQGGADLDGVAILQRAGLRLCPVQFRAIGALQVIDPPLALLEQDHRV